MSVKELVVRVLRPGALVLIGIVVMATSRGDDLPFTVGWAAAALGCIALTLLIFYEVGRSEDRAREKEQQQRRR